MWILIGHRDYPIPLYTWLKQVMVNIAQKIANTEQQEIVNVERSTVIPRLKLKTFL